MKRISETTGMACRENDVSCWFGVFRTFYKFCLISPFVLRKHFIFYSFLCLSLDFTDMRDAPGVPESALQPAIRPESKQFRLR